jgi:hypothetical protein
LYSHYEISDPNAENVNAFAVPLRTVIISVVAKVIPIVKIFVDDGAKVKSYAIAFDVAAAAPPILAKILNVADRLVVFVTTILETTAEVDDGTVYRLALLVSAGAD